jgi:hypothetical protein
MPVSIGRALAGQVDDLIGLPMQKRVIQQETTIEYGHRLALPCEPLVVERVFVGGRDDFDPPVCSAAQET